MTVVKTLRQTVAPELNHLYTIPPFATDTGMDCGWFSREHALHTFFVCRLAGAAAELRTGDFAVLSQAMPPLTSIDSGAEHAWCSVEDVVPVDLSLTFVFLGRVPQLKAPIAGAGPNGEWEVRYAKDDSLLDENVQKGNEILYIERKFHLHTEAALLENPYVFLDPPRIGDTQSWHALYGPDIYAKISLHCHRCSVDPAVSVCNRFPRAQAMAWIAENYPAPETQIITQLKS